MKKLRQLFGKRKQAEAQGKRVNVGRAFETRHGHAMPRCPENAPQHVKDQYAALLINTAQTRTELEALRSTRGKRAVGKVDVPAHLRTGDVLSDVGDRDARGNIVRPERRGDRAGNVLPATD